VLSSEKLKDKLNSVNPCYLSLQDILYSSTQLKNIKVKGNIIRHVASCSRWV